MSDIDDPRWPVEPTFPVLCPHGRQVGWALRNEPTTITDRRFCAECPECMSDIDDAPRDDWDLDYVTSDADLADYWPADAFADAPDPAVFEDDGTPL